MNYEQLLAEALRAEGASDRVGGLVGSIFTQESGRGKNTKTSNQGASGPMQIIPSTFKGYADKGWNIDNPLDNLRAGVRYVKDLDQQFGGDVRAAAAAYYGGPKAGKALLEGKAYRDLNNPNAPDTLQYANKVASRIPSYMVENTVVPAPKDKAVTLVNGAPVMQALGTGIRRPLSADSYSSAFAEKIARYKNDKATGSYEPYAQYQPFGSGAVQPAVQAQPETAPHPMWMDFTAPFKQSKANAFDWFNS